MIFTRLSAGKIWSSICIQDIVVLHYQINPVRLICLYQICLTGKSDKKYYLYIQNAEAH